MVDTLVLTNFDLERLVVGMYFVLVYKDDQSLV